MSEYGSLFISVVLANVVILPIEAVPINNADTKQREL